MNTTAQIFPTPSVNKNKLMKSVDHKDALALSAAKKHYELAKQHAFDAKNNERRLVIKDLVKQIIEQKNERNLSDQDFSELISLVLAKYVESEIEHLLMPKIERSMFSILSLR